MQVRELWTTKKGAALILGTVVFAVGAAAIKNAGGGSNSAFGLPLILIGLLAIIVAWSWAFLLAFAHDQFQRKLPHIKLFMAITGGIAYPIFLLQGLEVAGSAGDVALRKTLFNNFKLMCAGWCALIVGAVLL